MESDAMDTPTINETAMPDHRCSGSAAEEGILPLDVMLLAMREMVMQANLLSAGDVADVNGKKLTRLGLLVAAADVAKDAAPYLHARLPSAEPVSATSAKQASVAQAGVLVVPGAMTVAQWQAQAAAHAQQAAGAASGAAPSTMPGPHDGH